MKNIKTYEEFNEGKISNIIKAATLSAGLALSGTSCSDDFNEPATSYEVPNIVFKTPSPKTITISGIYGNYEVNGVVNHDAWSKSGYSKNVKDVITITIDGNNIDYASFILFYGNGNIKHLDK